MVGISLAESVERSTSRFQTSPSYVLVSFMLPLGRLGRLLGERAVSGARDGPRDASEFVLIAARTGMQLRLSWLSRESWRLANDDSVIRPPSTWIVGS